jgi:hypothetical protein
LGTLGYDALLLGLQDIFIDAVPVEQLQQLLLLVLELS